MAVTDDPESDEPGSKYSRLGLRPPAQGPPHRGPRLARGSPRRPKRPRRRCSFRNSSSAYKAAMGDRGLEEIEALSGVNKTSISRLLRGESWGTLPVIARLEQVLDTDLWGDEHR